MRISRTANTYNNFFMLKRKDKFSLGESKQETLNRIKTGKEYADNSAENSNKKSESFSKIIINPDGSRLLFIKTITSQGATFCQNIKLSDSKTFSNNEDSSSDISENENLEINDNISEIN